MNNKNPSKKLNRNQIGDERRTKLLLITTGKFKALSKITEEWNEENPDFKVSKPTILTDLTKLVKEDKLEKVKNSYRTKDSTKISKAFANLNNFCGNYCSKYAEFKDIRSPKIIYVAKGFEATLCHYIYEAYGDRVPCIPGSCCVMTFGNSKKFSKSLGAILKKLGSKNNENSDEETNDEEVSTADTVGNNG